MMPCHQAHGGAAVERSERPSGLGRLLAHLGFDSYTVSRYGTEHHHHKHGDGHHGHHKDHGKDGHHHGHHKDAAPGFESDGAFAPPPQDAEVRILPIFGTKDEAYAEKHVAAQQQQHARPTDSAAEAVTAFIRSLRFDTAYLVIGYIVGGALGFVAARKIRQARARRNAIRLDAEEAAPAPVVAAEKA